MLRNVAALHFDKEPYEEKKHSGAAPDYAMQARDIGINYIGACCGAVAIHFREMARVLGKVSEDERLWKKGE